MLQGCTRVWIQELISEERWLPEAGVSQRGHRVGGGLIKWLNRRRRNPGMPLHRQVTRRMTVCSIPRRAGRKAYVLTMEVFGVLDGSVRLKLYTSVHVLKHPIKGVLFMLSLAVKFQYKNKGRLISDMWVQLEKKLGLYMRVSVGGGW